MGVVANMRFLLQRILGRAAPCAHFDYIRHVNTEGDVCPQCVEKGDAWVHLRVCMTCGQIGCCDSSINKHAHTHADEVGHPIARSIEPGEDWMWCFIDATVVAPSS
jgi:monovalent cation:H+ antiporter-2, CPA2 family